MTADDELAGGDRQELTFDQGFARREVTERAIVPIWLGLRMIEVLTDEADAGVVADNSDVPLEMLAAGFERLMKAILVLGYFRARSTMAQSD